MENCLDHVHVALLCALEVHELFRLMRCSRHLRAAVTRDGPWRALTANYGFDCNTPAPIRTMRALLHEGAWGIRGLSFRGTIRNLSPSTMGNLHCFRGTITFVTRSGEMWKLDAEKRTSMCVRRLGNHIARTHVDPMSGCIIACGFYHVSAHTADGEERPLHSLRAATTSMSGEHVRQPHVLPSMTGHYVGGSGGPGLVDTDKHLVFVSHSAPSEHIIVSTSLMSYIRPIIVSGGIIFASGGRVYMWNELSRALTALCLPSEPATCMPRCLAVTGLGRPVVVTSKNVHVLNSTFPFESKFVCPLPLTHNVFSAPRILGELIVGCYVANATNRWIIDATTGRRCVHPRMRAFEGVITGSKCVAHISDRGLLVVQST